MTTLLPNAFAEFEPYAEIWCLGTETQRHTQRLASSMDELVEFYDAFFPRLEAAIDYCDTYSLDDLPDDVTHLLQLIYSLIMVAMSVEIFSQQKTVDAADAVLVRVREPAP
jgi:hypothetical protein